MNSSAVTVAFVALGVATAAGSDHAPEPSAFESFVAKPNVIVEFEQWVGSLVSTDAKLSVTALAAHDSADPESRMRGVRLTVEDNAGSDRVYVEESGFAALQRDLADVELGRAHMKSDTGHHAPWRVAGTASCWMPEQPRRILCPSYRSGPEGSGLAVAALGGRSFALPDRRPAELSALIDRAADLLKQPR